MAGDGLDLDLDLFSDADADDWRDQHIINIRTLGWYLSEIYKAGGGAEGRILENGVDDY